MAKVPAYESVSEPKALPGVRVDSVATPTLLGGAYDSDVKAGQATLAAGVGLSAVAYDMAERENADAVFRAETKIKQDYLNFQNAVSTERKGEKSKGVTRETTQWWDEAGKQHMEALGNDVQRALFIKRLENVRLSSIESMSKFEATQMDHALDLSSTASKLSAIDLAASRGDEKDARLAVGTIQQTNAFIAKRKGIVDQAVIDKMNEDDITNLHKQVIQTLAKDAPEKAAAYFEKYKHEIRGSLRAEIGDFAQKATAETVGDTVAGETWQKYRPQNSTDPINVSDAEDEIRKDPRLKNNPTALNAALKGFEHRTAVLEKQRHAQSVSLVARVEDLVIKGVRGPALTRSPEFAALQSADPKAANGIRLAIKNEAYSDMARSEMEYARNERRLQQTGVDIILSLHDPDVLASKSVDEIKALRSKIGTQQTTMFLDRHAALTRSAEALAAARLDQTNFNSMATQAGIDINPKKDSPEERRLWQLRASVDARIGLAAKTKGKPLSNEERIAEAQKAFDDTVRVPGFFSMGGTFPAIGTDLPASSLSKAEREKAVVRLPSGDVRVKDIPPLFVNDAEATLRKAGRAVTQKAVAEMWLLNKKTWKPGDSAGSTGSSGNY